MFRTAVTARARVFRAVIASRNRHLAPNAPLSPRATVTSMRTFCDGKNAIDDKDAANGKKSGFLGRILAPDDSGKNPLLRVLGYYSPESRAIGVGNSLYRQALSRAQATTVAEVGDSPDFSARFEMLAVHVYLTLRRLRAEKGSPYESEVKTVMQCMFDVFWTDVRTRMMIKDHGLSLITSGKWIKECEQRFFGMALAFDEAWDDAEEMQVCISRNLTCLKEDKHKIDRLHRYMRKERQRLDKTTIEQVWEGVCWDDKYTSPQAV